MKPAIPLSGLAPHGEPASGIRKLEIMFVCTFPPSPASFGAQRRMEGLMTSLARHHRITCVALVGDGYDLDASRSALQSYCDEVVLLPGHRETGISKRLVQVRSLLSGHSWEQLHNQVPALYEAADRLLRQRRYDIVSLEMPFLARRAFRVASFGSGVPSVLIDEHNVEYDLARQYRDASHNPLRWIYHSLNWRKVEREELSAWSESDGVVFTSDDDLARARRRFPSLRAAVVPNAVDTGYFQPRAELPAPDGQTLLFFGTMKYFPNLDAVRYLLEEIWPRVERSRPRARLKIFGAGAPAGVLRHRGPRVEIAGTVDDLRPHVAQAAAVIVPLRLGGGTRFKILEAMAMGRPVVSTTIGAEGLGVAHGRDILIADDPRGLAEAMIQVLDDPSLARDLGASALRLVQSRYSWESAASAFETFAMQLVR